MFNHLGGGGCCFFFCTCTIMLTRVFQTTGRCFCCDATVRWPTNLSVFRCTTCTTINDLKPVERVTALGSAPGPKGDIFQSEETLGELLRLISLQLPRQYPSRGRALS